MYKLLGTCLGVFAEYAFVPNLSELRVVNSQPLSQIEY